MNGNDWVTFTREEALRAHGVRIFSGDPPGIDVPRACPNCQSDARWIRAQVRGESPGRTAMVCAGCEHDQHETGTCPVGACQCRGGVGKLVAVPARRGLVVMRCYHCALEYRFGDVPFSDDEQAARTAALFGQSKAGKRP